MLASVNMVENDRIGGNKYKDIRKNENKIVKILAKNRNLYRSKKVQNDSAKEETNFLTSNTKVVFIKLRHTFIQILIL